MEHYRCVDIYFPKTRSVHHFHTVVFFSHYVEFPKVTLDDFLEQTASDLFNLLKHPPDTKILSLETGDKVCNAFLQISNALKEPHHQIPSSEDNMKTRVNKQQSSKDAPESRVKNFDILTDPDIDPTPSIAQRVKDRKAKKVQFNLQANKVYIPIDDKKIISIMQYSISKTNITCNQRHNHNNNLHQFHHINIKQSQH